MMLQWSAASTIKKLYPICDFILSAFATDKSVSRASRAVLRSSGTNLSPKSLVFCRNLIYLVRILYYSGVLGMFPGLPVVRSTYMRSDIDADVIHKFLLTGECLFRVPERDFVYLVTLRCLKVAVVCDVDCKTVKHTCRCASYRCSFLSFK